MEMATYDIEQGEMVPQVFFLRLPEMRSTKTHSLELYGECISLWCTSGGWNVVHEVINAIGRIEGWAIPRKDGPSRSVGSFYCIGWLSLFNYLFYGSYCQRCDASHSSWPCNSQERVITYPPRSNAPSLFSL